MAIASGNNVESKCAPSGGAKADVFGSANVEPSQALHDANK